MTRIIPGVQVTVVKEVVPPQLAPSGVLGLVGLTERTVPPTEKTMPPTERASSWSRFIEVCGPAAAFSLPEARLALVNGVFELVVVPLISSCGRACVQIPPPPPAFTLTGKQAGLTAQITRISDTEFTLKIVPKTGEAQEHKGLTLGNLAAQLHDSTLAKVDNISAAQPQASDHPFPLPQGKPTAIPSTKEAALRIEARAPGIWANGFQLKVLYRSEVFDLEIRSASARPDEPPLEIHRNLTPGTLEARINGTETQAAESALIRVAKADKTTMPLERTYILSGGTDASAEEYGKALEKLRDEPDVDMVLPAIQDFGNATEVTKIYNEVISHCQSMSVDGKGRIGFGQVPPHATLDQAKQMANTLLSDRFVLLAPHGVAGAVAGRIGSLEYFQSPTFKTLSGLVSLSRSLPLEEQGQLLSGKVVPVVDQRGRGVIILRGLTTDGDQISVRRVADRAVRGVKMIGELFIGRLNNEEGRGALKQKLAEFLTQMEKDGALVPSTDGKDPAFKLDVYSSQADFAQGIVRVNIAVRPVRAIDFIYATILVQV
jgi:hypothetical protein